MADWSQPTLSTVYADFLNELKERDEDSAKMFDGIGSNLTTNTIRWSSANSRFEKYNGTTWNVLDADYAINVASVNGVSVNDSGTSTSDLWTASQIGSFASNYYTKSQIDLIRDDYILKGGENGAVTIGTNDNSALTLESNNTARFTIGGSGNVTINTPASGVALTLNPAVGQDALTLNGDVSGEVFKSTISTGTAPLTVASTTKVTNLNADLFDGQDSAYYRDADQLDGQHGSYYRNASNINAGTISDAYLPSSISSSITGNSATATKLATPRTIDITGDITATGVAFDGSSNIAINASVNNDSHTHATQYLGLTAKASDSDKLDNLNSTQFLRSDVDATSTANITAVEFYGDGSNLEGVNRGFKNYIINGGFDVWQRGTTFTNPAYQTFMADRWDTSSGIVNGTVYNDGAVMDGSKNSFRIDNTVESDVYIRTALELEGKNFYEGQKLVLSYYVLSSSVFSFGAKIQTRDTKSSSANETIHYFDTPAQNTAYAWTRIEIPIVMGVINSTNTVLAINIIASDFVGTLRYANVQLEEGSVATPFEQRPYGLELGLCQRYYETGYVATGPSTAYTTKLVAGPVTSFAVEKRVAPTITLLNPSLGNFSYLSIQSTNASLGSFAPRFNVSSTTDGRGGYSIFSWIADAEL